jgi:hypothetical protein
MSGALQSATIRGPSRLKPPDSSKNSQNNKDREERGMGARRKPARPNGRHKPAPRARATARDREIEQLRRELKRVTWELDFLKEATAFLAKASRSGIS